MKIFISTQEEIGNIYFFYYFTSSLVMLALLPTLSKYYGLHHQTKRWSPWTPPSLFYFKACKVVLIMVHLFQFRGNDIKKNLYLYISPVFLKYLKNLIFYELLRNTLMKNKKVDLRET